MKHLKIHSRSCTFAVIMVLLLGSCSERKEPSPQSKAADLDSLLLPADHYVVSQVPVTTIRKGRQDITLDMPGQVDYDPQKEYMISARFAGRIERLYIKYRFQHVHIGDRIMDLYSPDLLTAQENLLFVVKNDASNTTLLEAAKERLLLLGMGRQDLQEVIRTGKPLYAVPVYSPYTGHIHEAGMATGEELSVKEGMYVEKGQEVFRVFNTDRCRVLLSLYPDQASRVKPGTPVTITPETAPEKLIRAKVDFIEPLYRAGSTTVTARAYFDNTAMDIPVGSQVKASIRLTDTDHDWLPNTAVLSLGLRQVALLKEGNGFRVKTIETGWRANGEVQVLKGLNEKDSVAVNAQYLMDSESFIKTKD